MAIEEETAYTAMVHKTFPIKIFLGDDCVIKIDSDGLASGDLEEAQDFLVNTGYDTSRSRFLEAALSLRLTHQQTEINELKASVENLKAQVDGLLEQLS